jgi:AraC-like DNA-binding protein
MTTEERAEYVRYLGRQLAELKIRERTLSAERGRLVMMLATEWTIRHIAEATDLSPSRVQQILNAARGINPAGWGHRKEAS